MSQSPRLGLPYINSFQAQKDITHNEALALLDGVVLAVAQSRTVATPPSEPEEGMVWVVPTTANGAWAGQEANLAIFTGGGWRFLPSHEGMRLWLLDEAVEARVIGGIWIGGDLRAASLTIAGQPVVGPRQAAIANPVGGSTIDSEARDALIAILDSLRSHGLIADS